MTDCPECEAKGTVTQVPGTLPVCTVCDWTGWEKVPPAEYIGDPKFRNRVRLEGADLCYCGCKYWEDDRCIGCGGTEPL